MLWLDLEKNGSFGWGPEVTFNSGFVSPVYLRMRNDLSCNIFLFADVARNLHRFVQKNIASEKREVCLIGIPTAGTQLAQAVATQSLTGGPPVLCFKSLRSTLKTHGKDLQYVGQADTQKHAYCTVENVLSSGKAMLDAFKLMEPEGYPVREMRHFVFASWNLGGLKALADARVRGVYVEYEIPDVIALFVHLDHWAREREEIMVDKIHRWRNK